VFSFHRSRIGAVLGLAMFLAISPRMATAQSLPDLVVTSVSSPPADANPGDSFSLTVVVTNQGTAATSVPPQSDNATTFNLVPVPGGVPKKNLKGIQIVKTPLAPGESDGASVPVTVAVFSDTLPGTYQIQACADGKEFVAESNESNNCLLAAGTITIHQVPDLVVNTIANPPAAAGQGQSFPVQDVVANVGPVASAPSTTKYSLVNTTDGTVKDLKLVSSNGVPGLIPGQTFNEVATVTVRAETVPGTYRLQACADGAKLIPELNNNNNCTTSTGTTIIQPRPDLVVTSVTIQPPVTVAPGDHLVVSAVVQNQGLATAPASALKLVLVNTVTGAEKNVKLLVPLSVPPLAVNASTTVSTGTNATVYSDTVSGSYALQACADSTKAIQESTESNNCGEAADIVTVLGGSTPSQADLVVTSVTNVQCSPETCANAIPGTLISFTATVMNQGVDVVNASVANPLTVGLFLIKGAIAKNTRKIDDSVLITQSIAPGGSVTQAMTAQIFSDTQTGAYALKVCADPTKAFAESNEANNCSGIAGVVQVNPVPNLQVISVQNPPAAAALGDSFSILTQIKNAGTVGTTVPTRTKFNLVSTATPPTREDLKGPSTPTVPALIAGAVFNETETLSIRTNTPLGDYFLEACTDGDKVVVESSEDDNCKQSLTKIHVNGLPDYVVTAVSFNGAPLSVKRGGAFTVNATVLNQGLGDATKTSVLAFKLVSTTAGGPVGRLSGTRTITPLAVGRTSAGGTVVTVFSDAPFGTYNVQACADATNVLLESATGSQGTTELNNCTRTTTTVQVTP